MNASEVICCTECGNQTLASRPVCGLCEADKGLFAPAAPAPASQYQSWCAITMAFCCETPQRCHQSGQCVKREAKDQAAGGQ